MADDMVTRLHEEVDSIKVDVQVLRDAAAEIERLRALIRSYADARDGIMLNWSADRKGHWDRFDAADEALLQEARRGGGA